MIQIHNLRFGFAANSSSTHYLIVLGKKSKVKDKLGDYFGWDFFTAATKSAKTQYLAGVLRNHLERVVGHDVTKDLIQYWLDVDIMDESLCLGVDHQSVPALPREWSGLGVNKVFFNDYKDFILQKHIAIIGGNDNTSKRHPRTRKYDPFILPLIYDEHLPQLVARKDPVFENWVIFNRNNGHKIRFTFTKEPTDVVRSSIPELVDIKITDYCAENCKFCYQGSTPEGQHGNTDYIRSLIYTLGQMEVFEVALGGGEPTSHPDFVSFLDSAVMYGIVPNFTTKTIKWLEDDDKRDRILSKIGSFAVSAVSHSVVRKLGFLMNKYNISPNKVQVQVIDGVISDFEFDQILNECSYHNITLVILGFKETGRGSTFKKTRIGQKKGWWIEAIKKARGNGVWCPIAVDTLIAKDYEDDLISEDIDRTLFSIEEGKFSCYVDCVQKRVGPSSYSPERMMDFSNAYNSKEFIEMFNAFG